MLQFQIIANHSHNIKYLLGDPEGSPSKIAIKVHCVEYKSDDTAHFSEHVIISYLL